MQSQWAQGNLPRHMPSGRQRSHDQIELLRCKRLDIGQSNIGQDMRLRLVTNQSRYDARCAPCNLYQLWSHAFYVAQLWYDI